MGARRRTRDALLVAAVGWCAGLWPGSARAAASAGRPESSAKNDAREPEPEGAGRAESDSSRPAKAPDSGEQSRVETPKERAKALYALGAEAFAARRNAEAIRYFQRAGAIAPNPKLSYNIAVAFDEMGDAARALSEYRGYLRHTKDQERRDEVKARIEELSRRLAESGVQQLTVLSMPAGARLEIDERLVGLTPWTGELEPGPHQVRLSLSGHRSERASVALTPREPGELSLSLEREAPPPSPETSDDAADSAIHPLIWGALGVGLAATAGGIAFEASRASSMAHARSADSAEDAASSRGAANAKQMTSLVLFGFGGGLLVAGGVMLTIELRSRGESTDATSTALACSPGFCGLVSRGTF